MTLSARTKVSAALPVFPWDTLADATATARAHADGIVDLSVGTPVDDVAPVIREALAAASASPGYPTTAGTPAVRASAVAALQRRYGITGLPEQAVLPVIGTKEVIAWLPTLLGLGAADTVVVPAGYTAQAIAPWGDPIGIPGAMPAWRPDASNSAADQAVQLGMHHDGMHFYPLADGAHGAEASRRGLLVMNHEYTDDGLLHPGGLAEWSAEKVRKAQAAHGVSVVEVALGPDGWQLVRPSRHARRFTASTPFAVGGPAAGHPLMRTAADPAGRTVLGTLNNCAAGMTPWGTYLSGEENWAGYFNGPDKPDAHQARWGIRKTDFYRWHLHDERFDAGKHPNEPNRFGWVVEVDPFDPNSVPKKRTSLGGGVAGCANGRRTGTSGRSRHRAWSGTSATHPR